MNLAVIYKKSKYELYSLSPDPEVRRYVQADTEEARAFRKSHDDNQRTLEIVLQELEKAGIKYEVHYRAELKGLDPKLLNNKDYVVSVGGDGTALEVSHYVSAVLLLGVNSDPDRSIGYFCCANMNTFSNVLNQIESMPRTTVSRLELTLNGETIPELVLNDVILQHKVPAAGTRLIVDDGTEVRLYPSTYGIMLCTAAGSTGGLYNRGGYVMPLNSKQIQYHVDGVRNEPFRFADQLTITSHTREAMIYIDGEHIKYPFGLGTIVEIRPAAPLTIIGDLKQKRARYT